MSVNHRNFTKFSLDLLGRTEKWLAVYYYKRNKLQSVFSDDDILRCMSLLKEYLSHYDYDRISLHYCILNSENCGRDRDNYFPENFIDHSGQDIREVLNKIAKLKPIIDITQRVSLDFMLIRIETLEKKLSDTNGKMYPDLKFDISEMELKKPIKIVADDTDITTEPKEINSSDTAVPKVFKVENLDPSNKRYIDILKRNNISNAYVLESLTDKDILKFNGVGKSTFFKLKEIFKEYHIYIGNNEIKEEENK